jgi:hypothetical protein
MVSSRDKKHKRISLKMKSISPSDENKNAVDISSKILKLAEELAE